MSSVKASYILDKPKLTHTKPGYTLTLKVKDALQLSLKANCGYLKNESIMPM